MAYKSKEKFLENNGKTWSYCHVDPKLGKPCNAHASHVSAKDFTNTLVAAVHGLEDHETENNPMSVFEETNLTKEEINAVSDLLLGKLDRENTVEASSLVKPANTEGYYVYMVGKTSPIYGNISLEEARYKAEQLNSLKNKEGEKYVVSRMVDGHRDEKFEQTEQAEADKTTALYDVEDPQKLLRVAMNKLAIAKTDSGWSDVETIKELKHALNDMNDLVVFRNFQFKDQLLAAQSIVDGSFFADAKPNEKDFTLGGPHVHVARGAFGETQCVFCGEEFEHEEDGLLE